LVVSLGADYDLAATPGFEEGGLEYYSIAGAERMRDVLPDFESAASRSGSRCAGGTRNGIPAALILCFARTSRFAIVSDGTRDARAISSVERPPSVRSVSATCASSASAGWQQVKRSSSRSSGIVVSSSTSSSVASGTS